MSASIHMLKFAVCLLLLGCSGDKQSPTNIATAEGGYDEAVVAFNDGHFQLAEDHLSAAIDAGGLNPDLIADAYLLRAECRTNLGKLDEAMADVVLVEQGAPDLGRFHQVRGDILLAQGDKDAAKQAYREATKIDKNIKLPDALR